MEQLITILALIAIGFVLVLIGVTISLLLVAKRVLRNVDKNFDQVTKDVHAIKEQSVEFMNEVNIFLKKATHVAEAIEEMHDPLMESITNLKLVSKEARSLLMTAKDKTQEFAYGIKSITDSVYEGYIRVVQPISKVITIVQKIAQGAEKIGGIIKRKEKKK